MEEENRRLLVTGARALGIDLGRESIEAFEVYLRELVKWNQKINLTAIRTEREVVTKHFLDSLCVSPYLGSIFSLLDIGSGAGFPGIPLKIIHPNLKVTLIDSVRKKVDFQRHVIRTLRLEGAEAIHGRAQDRTLLQTMESRFDAVISRAFSSLQNFLTLGHPFLKKGGVALAMKGTVLPEETSHLTGTAGSEYRLKDTIPLSIPSTSLKRSLLLFEKA